MTTTTITLPDKAETELEQIVLQDQSKAQQQQQNKVAQLPSPKLGGALEQIEAERQKSQITQIFLSNKQSEPNFVQLK